MSVFYNVLNVKDVIEVDEPVVTPIGTPPELKLWAQSIEAQQISLELMANICTVDQEYTELGEVNEGVSMCCNYCKLLDDEPMTDSSEPQVLASPLASGLMSAGALQKVCLCLSFVNFVGVNEGNFFI